MIYSPSVLKGRIKITLLRATESYFSHLSCFKIQQALFKQLVLPYPIFLIYKLAYSHSYHPMSKIWIGDTIFGLCLTRIQLSLPSPILKPTFSNNNSPFHNTFPSMWWKVWSPQATNISACGVRGIARIEHLGGLGCNRNLLNIILKSIGYKIINFHISSYTWTCWEFNRNFKPERNKKTEKKKTPKEKQSHAQDSIYVVRQFAYVHRVAGISLL